MSAGHDPSAYGPTSGNSRFPDPFAPPAPPADGGSRTPQGSGTPPPGPADAASGAGSGNGTAPGTYPAPAAGATPSGASPAPAVGATPAGTSTAPGTAPGDRDLPWKATAERRDLWGPVQKPLEGTVRSPGSTAVGRPRRSPLLRFGVPVLLGGVAAVLTLAVGLGTGLAGPLLALAAAAGLGGATLVGSGALLSLPRRAQEQRSLLDASVTGSTRTVLESILEADARTRAQVAQLRPQASSTPSAATVLEDLDALVTRIDALVGAEQLQSQRSSSGEVTMLEGIACRYVPDLVTAASDTLGFLRTFEGTARQEALANLESIDRQLDVLEEGVERIEADLVDGVSRSLEVHAEFLRTRFADQHLNPIIDV